MLKTFRSALSLLLCLTLVITQTGCEGETEQPAAETEAAVSELSGSPLGSDPRNRDIPRPQDDFYGYINKEALLNCEINYKTDGAGTFIDIMDTVDEEIKELLDSTLNSTENFEAGSSEQLVRDFYRQWIDFLNGADCSIDEEYGYLSEKITAVSDIQGCKDMLRELREHGICSVCSVCSINNVFAGEEFAPAVAQISDPVGYSLLDIYEEDGARTMLSDFAMSAWIMTGLSDKEAEEKAKSFVYALIDLGRETDFDVTESVDFFSTLRYKTTEEMNSYFTNITLDELLDIYGYRDTGRGVIINDEKQLKAIDALFAEDKVEVLKTWMLCSLVNEYAPLLSRDHDFRGSYDLDTDDPVIQDKLARSYVRTYMTRQISDLYVKKYYTDEMDAEIRKMFDEIIDSYDSMIKNAGWLTEEMRSRLLVKLHEITLITGKEQAYVIKPENRSLIGKDAAETVRNINISAVNADIALLDSKVDRTSFEDLSYNVNASYDSMKNVFNLDAAILHAPMFDPKADHASNLGGIGFIMGHEVGHAFDSQNILIDEKGRYLPESVPEQDMAALKEGLGITEDYFSEYTVMGHYHVNGRLTSGENYADKGSMECIMNMKLSDAEKKKFFESYARAWKSMTEDASLIYQLENDPHSPEIVRINAILSSTDEFYRLYGVSEGDGMYIPPEKRFRRWY